MMAAAAIILGISLIFMGVVIIGSSLGWWDIQDDVWGWIVAVLATVSRWVGTKIKKPEPDAQEELNGEKPGTKTGAVLIVLFFFGLCAGGCAGLSPQTKAGLSAFGSCVGAHAIGCAASSTGADLEETGIKFSACMASGAILCVPVATAASNPPTSEPKRVVDLACLHTAFKACHRSKTIKACTARKSAACAQ